jgi:hypothetical protein
LTPEELSLDPDVFLANQSLILYRLARAKYANLSGVGAALAPGRWNRVGQEAIYTSMEMGVPLLERLAHTPKDLVPSNLALMKIRVSGAWDTRYLKNTFKDSNIGLLWDSNTNGRFYSFRTLAAAKNAFTNPSVLFGAEHPFAVAVPSVIVPAWNVVLYPQAVGFWDHVAIESVERFEFDPRLFPENTPIETPEQEGPA